MAPLVPAPSPKRRARPRLPRAPPKPDRPEVAPPPARREFDSRQIGSMRHSFRYPIVLSPTRSKSCAPALMGLCALRLKNQASKRASHTRAQGRRQRSSWPRQARGLPHRLRHIDHPELRPLAPAVAVDAKRACEMHLRALEADQRVPERLADGAEGDRLDPPPVAGDGAKAQMCRRRPASLRRGGGAAGRRPARDCRSRRARRVETMRQRRRRGAGGHRGVDRKARLGARLRDRPGEPLLRKARHSPSRAARSSPPPPSHGRRP